MNNAVSYHLAALEQAADSFGFSWHQCKGGIVSLFQALFAFRTERCSILFAFARSWPCDNWINVFLSDSTTRREKIPSCNAWHAPIGTCIAFSGGAALTWHLHTYIQTRDSRILFQVFFSNSSTCFFLPLRLFLTNISKIVGNAFFHLKFLRYNTGC